MQVEFTRANLNRGNNDDDDDDDLSDIHSFKNPNLDVETEDDDDDGPVKSFDDPESDQERTKVHSKNKQQAPARRGKRARKAPSRSRKRQTLEEEEEEQEEEQKEEQEEGGSDSESHHISTEVCTFLGDTRYHSRTQCIFCTYKLGTHYNRSGELPYVPVGDGTMDTLLKILKDGYRDDQIEGACISMSVFWNTHVKGQNTKYINDRVSDLNLSGGEEDDEDIDPEWSLGLDTEKKSVEYRPLKEATPKLVYDHFIFHTTPQSLDVVKDLRNTNYEIHRIRSKIDKTPKMKQLGLYLPLVKSFDTMCKLKIALRKELYEMGGDNGPQKK